MFGIKTFLISLITKTNTVNLVFLDKTNLTLTPISLVSLCFHKSFYNVNKILNGFNVQNQKTVVILLICNLKETKNN